MNSKNTDYTRLHLTTNYKMLKMNTFLLHLLKWLKRTLTTIDYQRLHLTTKTPILTTFYYFLRKMINYNILKFNNLYVVVRCSQV
jgi:hypothetical protein